MTLPLKPVATLFKESFNVTSIAGETPTPAMAVVGCTVNDRIAPAPANVLNGSLVAPVKPVAVTARV